MNLLGASRFATLKTSIITTVVSLIRVFPCEEMVPPFSVRLPSATGFISAYFPWKAKTAPNFFFGMSLRTSLSFGERRSTLRVRTGTVHMLSNCIYVEEFRCAPHCSWRAELNFGLKVSRENLELLHM